MEIKKVRWGIIGCGDVCEVKSGPAFYKTEHSELVAVMRRNSAKAEDFAKRHRVKRWYTDATELINDDEVDIVYVATPPDTHKKYAIEAMKAGKPVYVEKPMALTYHDCLEMIRISEETKQKLFPAFYRRALPYFLKVKEIIDSGITGEPLTVEVQHYRAPAPSDIDPEHHTWRVDKRIAGEGYFYDLAPHTLDILEFLLGEISAVKAFSSNMGKLYNVKDTISALFSFKSGIIGNMNYCFVASPSSEREYVHITGKKGEIRFTIFESHPIEVITESGRFTYDFPRPEHIQQPLILTIVSELRGAGICPANAESAARTSWILEQVAI